MIANLDEDRNGRNDWNVQSAQAALAVGIWSGLRPSEIAALQWQSGWPQQGNDHVRKAFVYGQEKASTKTGRPTIVPFKDKLTPVPRAWWWETNQILQSGWVFPNRGNPVNLNNLSDRSFARIVRNTNSQTAVPRVGECTEQAISLADTHLREEPDALLCALFRVWGGAPGKPASLTAISSSRGPARKG